MSTTFGKRVLQARLSLSARLGRQVTQGQVAAKMGITGVTVSRWEADLKEPTLETITKLARVLGVEPAWLAFGTEKAPSSGEQDASFTSETTKSVSEEVATLREERAAKSDKAKTQARKGR